jgi:hypothetical protein
MMGETIIALYGRPALDEAFIALRVLQEARDNGEAIDPEILELIQ